MANVKATDLIDFTRASKGHALAKVSYGEELVTNGTFDTDSDWTKGSGWSISGGVAVSDGGSTFTELRQTISGFDTDKVYKFSFNLVVNSGVARFFADGTAYENLTSSGTYEYIIKPTSSAFSPRIQSRSPAFDGTVDNFSVKEVIFNQADGTLQLFEHPNNIPRIEYDADGNLLGLLVEEARTNIVTYSEDFSQSSWSKIRSSVSQSSIQAPDGTTSAFVMTPSAGLNTHYIADAISGTSGSRSISFFAKKKEYSVVFVGHGIGVQEGTYFDLDAGTITSEGTDIDASTITPLPNGWYRCAITFDSVIEPRYAILAPCESSGSTSFNADGTSGVYIYGAQFEVGSFPTSYIKSNSGSTTTRPVDVASIPVADFGYNQSEGTMFVEASSYKGIPKLLHLNDGSDSNRAQITASASNVAAYVQATGDSGSFISVTGAPTVPFKAALGIETNDMGLTVNGSSVSTDTSQNVPVSITKLNIGSAATGGSVGQAHIKSIKYFPKRLSNAKLQELTS